MDDRQWATFVAQAGIQADRTVKTFTPQWTGFSVDPVGDLSYYDFGTIVVIWNNTGGHITGTSDSVFMQISNLPSSIVPDNSVYGTTTVIDASSTNLGHFLIAGGLLFGQAVVDAGNHIPIGPGGFSAAGVKGLPDGWLIVYSK